MGDIVATAVAITGVAVLFLAGSYAIIALTRLGAAVMRLLGG